MPFAAKTIISILGAILAIATCLYDFDKRHTFNPLWPAHARYHCAAYALMNAGSGVFAIYALWFLPGAEFFSIALLAWPAIVMFAVWLVPGTSPVADGEKILLRMPVALWGSLAYLLALLAGAVVLG